MGDLYLGSGLDPEHRRTGEWVAVGADSLTTHGVIVGMTGSGKTGAAITLVEEALLAGVPVLAIDPKGDLANLALVFPELRAADFAPWVPAGSDPAAVAQQWRDGLADWGIGPDRLESLRAAAGVTVYTPGSDAGAPLALVGNLDPPVGAGDEARREQVEATVTALLGLAGIDADPLSSREHILLSNLIDHAWSQNSGLDMAALVEQVRRPPLRRLGVIDLESYFPAAERERFALALNGLLASPAFAAWAQGPPLDIARMLWRDDGGPRAAVVSIAHLDDAARQFVVSLVLARLVTWMRSQPGTDALRVLVYMDEVFGFVPPSAMPPAKKPILTILKQARAFGVGMVLATQNPVDLDYKALSNAGTWLIGRLQTERDKARLLDGLSAAAGSVDLSALSDTIAGLAKREFLLHRSAAPAPVALTTRWAMAYLAGPLTREQIARLPIGEALGGSSYGPGEPRTSSRGRPSGNHLGLPPHPVTAAGADETAVMPVAADGLVPVRYLDPAATWAEAVGAVPGGRRLQAAVLARCRMRFDDTALALDHTEEWEAVWFPPQAPLDATAAVAVDYDDRDLLADAPASVVYVVPEVPLAKTTYWRDAKAALAGHLQATRRTTMWRNRDLKLASRAGETEAEFRARCDAAAAEGADGAADKLRTKYAARIERAGDALAKARDRVEELQGDVQSRRAQEVVAGAGDVLGMFLGGRTSARGIARAVSGASSRRGMSSRTSQRVESAEHRAAEKEDALAALEADLADELVALDEAWTARAAAVETVEVPLEKSDVTVTDLTVVWVPT